MTKRMAARRIVVTGAAGLVGRSVVQQLAKRGDDVVAVIRQASSAEMPAGVSALIIDLAERPEEALARIGPFDALIHLAQAPGWHAFPKWAGAIARINVAASMALAEAAIAAGARCMVMASSGGIHGPSATPIREDDPIRPGNELGCYLASKIAAENLLSCFQPYLPIHILRPFFVYGPRQSASFLIPRLIGSVRAGMPVRVDNGTGPAMNPIWVEDAAAAFVAALDCDAPLTASIAGPDIVTVRDIATLIAARLDVSAVFEETARAPQNYIADTAIMKQRLGAPAMPFSAGLSAMIANLSPES
jgi:UDP-glucose 4-epimerase